MNGWRLSTSRLRERARRTIGCCQFWDPSRARRLVKVAAWLVGIALLVVVLELVGVDVSGWFSDLWNAVTVGSVGYQLVGLSAQTVQTTLTALAWYFILRAGFPGSRVDYKEVLAAYATGVAMNGFLPANIGTVVTLLMFVAIIPTANLAGVLGAAAVQKVFFVVASAFVYVYLFASVPGSFELQLGGPHDHPIRTALIVAGAVILVVLAGRILWPKLREAWEEAKQGGAILARPREYAVRVVLPSLGAWLAKAGVIAAFLASYGITVSFHAVMAVMAGNSIGHTVSAYARRSRRKPGDQCGRPARPRRRGHHSRLLAGSAVLNHGVEHRLRRRRGDLGVWVGWGQGAGRAVIRRREGAGESGPRELGQAVRGPPAS